jgi:hypothetical protein
MRRGSFPLKGKSKEIVALDFWKWIKNEHPLECRIDRRIVDGEEEMQKEKRKVILQKIFALLSPSRL